MNTTNAINVLFTLRSYIHHYLRANDTEDFGCACLPDKTCGTCKERKRQEALIASIKLIEETTTGMIITEEQEFKELVDDTSLPKEAKVSRWWFNKGYQSKNKVKLSAWQEAIIDELVVLHIYNKKHDADPVFALKEAIDQNVGIALDPLVSESAQALIDQGYKKGFDKGYALGGICQMTLSNNLLYTTPI